MAERPSIEQWHVARRFPRIPLTTSLEIHARQTQGAPIVGNLENVSLGGLLATCREPFDHSTELAVEFQLPNGRPVRAFGRVAYAVQGHKYGIQFTHMEDDGRAELERLTQKMLGYNRRSGRIPYRVHVTLRPAKGPGEEEPAMTVLASRNGGLLVCRRHYCKGEEFILRWPDRDLGTRARVVFEQVWQEDQLVELGFEFLDAGDFWELEFPEETKQKS